VIGYLSVLSVLVVALAFVFSTRAGILATLLLHPIAASGWHVNYFLLGVKINPLVLLGLLVPLFVFARAFTRGPSFNEMPLFGIWTVYLCYSIFAGTLHAIDAGPARSTDLIFRHIGGFVGFYMMQAFFTDRENFKKLLLALIASGLFPVLIILFQIATGQGTLREMSEGGDLRLDEAMGLVRYQGYYHDIVSVRGYVFQCLAGIILYWAYFLKPNRDIAGKVTLGGLAVGALFVLYKMYSKAVILTILIWFGVWSYGYRKLGLGIALGLLLIAINAVQSDRIFGETEQLFRVEISEAGGDSSLSTGRLLHGRVGVWENILQGYFDAPVIKQLVGVRPAFGAHNDFIQKLLYGGVFGLVIYCLLLWMIGVRVAQRYFQEKSPINLMAVMVFGGWLIDTIGVVPSLYPGYQWYAWGIIGLAIKGLDFEKNERLAASPRPSGPIWLRDDPPPVPERRS
jgi:hypothetical protein